MLLEIDVQSPDLNSAEVQDALIANSVIILRNAFSPEDLPELFDNLSAFRDVFVESVETECIAELPDHFVYNAGTQSCDIFAIDPNTLKMIEGHSREKVGDMAALLADNSSFISTLKNSYGWPIISALLPDNPVFHGGRVRVVHHKGGQPKDNKGAVALHQEKWALRGQNMPDGFNLWMVLNPEGGTANLDLPGLQFVLGDKKFWEQPLPENLEEYTETIRPRVLRLNGLCRKSAESAEELVEVEGSQVYRPKINVGDIALFNHHIPHGSFVPAKASATRLSCEFRVFPRDLRFADIRV